MRKNPPPACLKSLYGAKFQRQSPRTALESPQDQHIMSFLSFNLSKTFKSTKIKFKQVATLKFIILNYISTN